MAVLKSTPDTTFKFNIWKSLIEKNLQMKVLAYSHNFITGFNWFWENVKRNLYFLGKSYRVYKDIQYIPNALFLIWTE